MKRPLKVQSGGNTIKNEQKQNPIGPESRRLCSYLLPVAKTDTTVAHSGQTKRIYSNNSPVNLSLPVPVSGVSTHVSTHANLDVVFGKRLSF